MLSYLIAWSVCRNPHNATFGSGEDIWHPSEDEDIRGGKEGGNGIRRLSVRSKSMLTGSMLTRSILTRKANMRFTDDNEVRRAATHSNTLQHTATHCNTLQHAATRCNTMKHTATYRSL